MNHPTTYSTFFASILGLIYALCLGLLCAGAWYVFSARSAVEAEWGKVIRNQTQALQLQRQASLAVRTKQLRSQLAGHIVPEGGTASYLSRIEAIGDAIGAATSVTALAVTAPGKGKPGMAQLTLAVSGSYSACMRFVASLESYAVANSISAVSLTRQEKEDQWNGTLTLSALSLDKP